MTRGEERATVFLLTAVPVGCLTEAVTRTVSLMRVTVSAGVCFILGGIFLIVLLLHLLLSTGDD